MYYALSGSSINDENDSGDTLNFQWQNDTNMVKEMTLSTPNQPMPTMPQGSNNDYDLGGKFPPNPAPQTYDMPSPMIGNENVNALNSLSRGCASMSEIDSGSPSGNTVIQPKMEQSIEESMTQQHQQQQQQYQEDDESDDETEYEDDDVKEEKGENKLLIILMFIGIIILILVLWRMGYINF
jgi:hypothetical protein